MIFTALMYPYAAKKIKVASEGGHLYQILIEKDCEFHPSQYNNLFDSLYTIYNPKDPYSWLSFEFFGTREGIRLYVWTTANLTKEFLQSNINAVHPSAEVVPASDYTSYQTERAACASLELDSHYLFNLLQSDSDKVGAADMIASLCASLQNLDDNESVWVQFTLRPVDFRTLAVATGQYEAYKTTGKRPTKVHLPTGKYTGVFETPLALAAALKFATTGTAGSKDHNTSLTSIQKKLEAGVYFDLNIRLVAQHFNFEKRRARLGTVISAFAPATDKNRLRPYTNYREVRHTGWKKIFDVTEISRFIEEYRSRTIAVYPTQNYVTPAELATVLHFPGKNVPGIIRLRAKKLPVPEGICQYDSVKEAWADNAIVFGLSDFRGRTKYLAFKNLRMLMQHVYTIGGTGSGKSYWLVFIALQLARQKQAGLTFFDVKGDIADTLLAHLPKSEWSRVHMIDLQDVVRFLPFNFLRQPGVTVYNLATMIVSVFLRLNSEGSIKEHSQSILRRALIAVISTNPEGSILEVYRMFTDEAYMTWTINKMQIETEYPDVLSYWLNYAHMSVKARQVEAKAILNKLEIITQNELPRYMLCQKNNAYNWRKLIDDRSIIIVNFALDKNEKEIISFFGTLFTAFISRAIFSRGDTPEAKRVPHIFFLDEFEMFIEQQEDMQKFLEIARSYGLGLVLAHQSVEQLPDKLMGMIEDNTFTQISLLIGTSSATKIKRMFPGVTEDDLTSMVEHTGYGRFKKIHPNPLTFDSIDMNNYFSSASEADVLAWKEAYKNKYYKYKEEIKGDIQERYGLTQKNKLTEDGSATVKTGRATGKLKRGM